MYSGGKSFDGDYPLLSTAIEGGLFHPRCKDSTSTYYEGITTLKPVSKEEMAEMDRREKLEEQQSYYENQAKKNKRIADNSLDKDNQRIYKFRADENAKKADEIGEKLTKSIAKSDSSGIIKSKVSDRLINIHNDTDNGVFDFVEIENNLLLSEVGRSTAKYIEDEGMNITMNYDTNVPRKLCGEILGKNITVCAVNHYDLDSVSETIIHEICHRRFSWDVTQEDEINCRLYEHFHKHEEISDDEISKIVDFVRREYSEYPQGELYGY